MVGRDRPSGPSRGPGRGAGGGGKGRGRPDSASDRSSGPAPKKFRGSAKGAAPPRGSKAAFTARQRARDERALRDAGEGAGPHAPARAGSPRSSARPAEDQRSRSRPEQRTDDRSGRRPDHGMQGHRADERGPDRSPAEPRVAAPTGPRALPVQTLTVTDDESGMRLDRFIEVHAPGLPFAVQQRIVRKGEVRIDGGRAKPSDRLEAGQVVRIPPLRFDTAPKPRAEIAPADPKILAELKAMTLYEDDDMMVLNKPMGLAVQGGIGMVRHIDGMLDALRGPDGERPRLVHRIDKDTAGCLLIAKTRFAASELTRTFRTRSARKVYWALIAGVPKVKQGRISTYLAKDEEAEAAGEAKMRVARHGEDGAAHAVTYYAVVEHAPKICAWVSLKPVTGRTHQLRAHMNHIGNPIIGDPKYFIRENWELPPGMQNRLHLLARRIVVPHPRTGKPVDVTAPMPPHMHQSFVQLSFDTKQYDPIEDSPEE